MDIQQAQSRYAELKALAHAIKKEKDQLREYILSRGIDPDFGPERASIVARNKEMYIARKGGHKLKDLASKYHLSATTIRSICIKIDAVLQTKRNTYKDYKDLLSYKVGGYIQ